MLERLIYGHFNDSQTNQDAFRYTFITNAIALVHFIFCITFFLMKLYQMGIYNIVVVILYLIIAHNLSNLHSYAKIFFFYLGEIIIHSSLATYLVGWEYGFMFYLVSLIPVSFYLAFAITSFKRRLFYPFFTSGLVFITVVASRIYTFIYQPPFQVDAQGFRVFLYLFNIGIALTATFLFSALFAIEVNSMQLIMESEQEKLEDQASIDPLTHFLNRRSMEEKLNNAHRNALINSVTYSLIMCDIDHFKTFNDSYGHDCGDYVLQSISKIITTQVRSKDSVCRWGGEEFLILVSDSNEIARDVAERIRKSIEEYEFFYEGQSLHVTITLGVSTYFTSSKVKTLIDIADKRLYKGKENGRNQVVTN